LQEPPKFTQIWIFGLKTSHLATLMQMRAVVDFAGIFLEIRDKKIRISVLKFGPILLLRRRASGRQQGQPIWAERSATWSRFFVHFFRGK
jgi:hypothetical protein